MTVIRLVTLALAALGGIVPVLTQTRTPGAPTFAGQWSLDKTGVVPSVGRPDWAPCGWECTISHTPTRLSVTTKAGRVTVFPIGGTPLETKAEGFGQATTIFRSAQWDRTQLITTVITGPIRTTATLSLQGRRLLITVEGDGRGGTGGGRLIAYTAMR